MSWQQYRGKHCDWSPALRDRRRSGHKGMFMATYAHKRKIEAGCLALRRGVRATTMRRFRCDVTIGPEAEHQSWEMAHG